VLWRGKPGWWSSGSKGSAEQSSGATRIKTAVVGGRQLSVSFGPSLESVRVGDQNVETHGHNVILVDGVDESARPRISTLAVDPRMPDGRRIDVVIQSSPELRAWLQCDARLPDARMQATVDFVCAQMAGQAARP
jgi:hypothetical protein